MSKKLTTEEFVERAGKVHGDRYNYSQVEYLGRHKNVTIVCPDHGPFRQTPGNHLYQKSGCAACSGEAVVHRDSLRM